jgi:hypothetical protein
LYPYFAMFHGQARPIVADTSARTAVMVR